VLALIVGGAGAAGALARYMVDGTVQDRTRGVFPFGTLTVNVVGSLVMGFVTGLVLFHGIGKAPVRIVGTGFCGGLTTWSTVSWETVRLWQEDESPAAFGNLVGGLAASLGAAACGLLLAAI
jgi:CrcB protein